MNHFQVFFIRIASCIALFCILTLGLPNISMGASDDTREFYIDSRLYRE
jgi:hypothetical protein